MKAFEGMPKRYWPLIAILVIIGYPITLLLGAIGWLEDKLGDWIG
ncbi:hypothetical protein SEA_ZIKO_1 [Gordonia phage Ziko]|uniref:Uncharacterized protein n=1 Tax=Gordonia phage Ziko TaxID=2591193 RepID=A0A514A518_9CAUD|nr:hypothetical protein SEA_ZIKO_1 [Gordonia phage Ziko]